MTPATNRVTQHGSIPPSQRLLMSRNRPLRYRTLVFAIVHQ
jgi:hypothetical protein